LSIPNIAIVMASHNNSVTRSDAAPDVGAASEQ
jgi:hypothetical protein